MRTKQSFFHYRFRWHLKIFWHNFFEWPLNPHPFKLKARKELRRLLDKGYSERQAWYIMKGLTEGMLGSGR